VPEANRKALTTRFADEPQSGSSHLPFRLHLISRAPMDMSPAGFEGTRLGLSMLNREWVSFAADGLPHYLATFSCLLLGAFTFVCSSRSSLVYFISSSSNRVIETKKCEAHYSISLSYRNRVRSRVVRDCSRALS
jgi:hypothetical protein